MTPKRVCDNSKKTCMLRDRSSLALLMGSVDEFPLNPSLSLIRLSAVFLPTKTIYRAF
jgi:hypothetical protein